MKIYGLVIAKTEVFCMFFLLPENQNYTRLDLITKCDLTTKTTITQYITLGVANPHFHLPFVRFQLKTKEL